MQRRVILALALAALGAVVVAIALATRGAPPEPTIAAASEPAAAPAPPPAPATPASPEPAPAPAIEPPSPPPAGPVRPPGAPFAGSARGLGAGPASTTVGRRPAMGAPLERLLAQAGQSPLAEARAATNPRDAVAAYDRYLAANPNGALREQAMVGRAGAFESMGDRAQAATAWRALLAAYPHSMSAPQARRRLIALER
jgi:2-oxoglutarate dehydrogenase E2 component (dihydrolipoamide succinyltransferase)